MESGLDVARNPKRARDDDGDDDNPESSSSSSHKSKKQEFLKESAKVNKDDGNSQLFCECDGIGVFDFPWLKEGGGGLVFQVKDFLEPQDMFTPCLDPGCPPQDYYYHDSVRDQDPWELAFDGGGEGLLSWKFEDFKSVDDDGVWR